MSDLVCALLRHMPDGTEVMALWDVDEQLAAEVQRLLGEPDAQQLLTVEQVQRAGSAGEQVLTVFRD